MENIKTKIEKLLTELDKGKLKEGCINKNVLFQIILQDLMLTYAVDIQQQVEQKELNLISAYPTELISSLKVITELYLKIRDVNQSARISRDSCFSNTDHVF